MRSRVPILLLLAPLLLYLTAVFVFPALYAIKLAFTDTATGYWPTLANFRVLVEDPLFWRALANNFVLPVASVVIELVAGLALALFMAARIPARRLLRTIVIVPFALPEIVFLTIMRYIFAPRGYANGALAAAGVPAIDWLLPARALTFLTVVAVDAWHVTPVVFLMLLAGLAAVPTGIMEAAILDGAGFWSRLRFILLPVLRPVLVAAVLLRGVDALRVFATPLVLSGVEGVPVLSTYAYHQWSDYGDDAAAAAVSVVLALLSILVTMPLLRRRMQA